MLNVKSLLFQSDLDLLKYLSNSGNIMDKSILSSDIIKSYQDELVKAYNPNLAVKQEYIQDSHVQGGGYYKNVRYNPNKDEGTKKVWGMHDHVADNFETFSIKDSDKNFKYKSKREQKLFGDIVSRLEPTQLEACRGTGICASHPGALEWLQDTNFNVHHMSDLGLLAKDFPFIRKITNVIADDFSYANSMRYPATRNKLLGVWSNPNSTEKEPAGSHIMLHRILNKIQKDNPSESENVKEYEALLDTYQQTNDSETKGELFNPRFLNINTKLLVAWHIVDKMFGQFTPTKDFVENLDTSKPPSGMILSAVKIAPRTKSISGFTESALESKKRHGEKAEDTDREIKCKIAPLSLQNQNAIQAHIEKYWSGDKKPTVKRVFKISGLPSETSYTEAKGDKKSAVLFYPTNDTDLTTVLGQQGGFNEPVHLNKLPSTSANNLVLCEVVQGTLTKEDGYGYLAKNPKTVIPRYIIQMNESKTRKTWDF